MKKIILLVFVFVQTFIAKAQWSQITSPYPGNLWTIVFTDNNHGFCGGNTALLSTSDGGVTWASTNISSFMVNDISFSPYSTDTGFYGANNTIVGKTVNQGLTWTTIDPGVSPWGVKAIEFISGTTGFIGTDGGQILKTINGGTSWTQQSPGIGISDVSKIHFFDANTGVFCAESGYIRRTVNGGGTWTSVSSGTSSTLYDMFFVNSSIGYICGASGKLLKSTDGGASWSPLTSGTTQYLYSVCFKNTTEGYAGGAHGTLLHTIDGGLNWSSVTSSTVEDINDIAFVGTRFIGVCAAGKIITDISVGIDEINSISSSVFPNPSNNEIQISLTENRSDASVIIYDSNGKKVFENSFEGYSIRINTSEFSSGEYYYSLETKNSKSSKGKFVVVR